MVKCVKFDQFDETYKFAIQKHNKQHSDMLDGS